jgi:hypothetical protein
MSVPALLAVASTAVTTTSQDKTATALGELAAGLVIIALVALLQMKGSTSLVANEDITYTDAPAGAPPATNGTQRTIKKGATIPAALKENPSVADKYNTVKRSWLGAIITGQDNRTSTSKTVVLLWTLAEAFGLLALILGWIFGNKAPWSALVGKPLQAEYLLLLGGPYAAAVVAKFATSSSADSKTTATPGTSTASQLVTDDDGNGELGDLQYVLFNIIGLVFFLGTFIPHPYGGFPDLPALLTGLMLTSVAGYSAKKFLTQGGPTLSSVVPARAAPGATVTVYGSGLTIPADLSSSGAVQDATILIGQVPVAVTQYEQVFGNDALTVKVPEKAADGSAAVSGSAPISAVRPDGVRATTSGGATTLAFEVVVVPDPRTGDGGSVVTPPPNPGDAHAEDPK